MARKKPTKRTPFRNIDKDGVTYSFLATFLQCREQARLSYVEGLTEAGLIPALEFGQLFHLGFELAAEGQPPENIVKVTSKYNKKNAILNRITPEERREHHRLTSLVNMMFPHYYNYWVQPRSKSNDTPRGLEFLPHTEYLAREKSFEYIHTLPNGRDIKLRGRFDAILRVKNDIWIMENKTKSLIDEDGLTAYLPFDLQTMLYAYTCQQEFGVQASGVLYNVVKRPGHRWNPEKESVEEHVLRVEESIVEAPEKYFMRWNTTLTPHDITSYINNILNPLLMQVTMWWDSIKENPFDPFQNGANPHHFMNPEGLYTKFGKSSFFELLTRNSTFGLERRAFTSEGREVRTTALSPEKKPRAKVSRRLLK